ncbi:hypothetical protein ACFE04_002764 [Oxalis oulophora]
MEGWCFKQFLFHNRTTTSKLNVKVVALFSRTFSSENDTKETSATSFNAYEYYWRPKPVEEQYSKNNNGDNQKFVVSRSCKDEGFVMLKGKSGDYLAKGFKEPRMLS